MPAIEYPFEQVLRPARYERVYQSSGQQMNNIPLRNASIVCLAIWAAVWFMFLLMRFTPIDIRNIPGIGMIMLAALAIALLAPLAATALAGIALARQPRVSLNWLLFGCAIAALVGQGVLFLISKWL